MTRPPDWRFTPNESDAPVFLSPTVGHIELLIQLGTQAVPRGVRNGTDVRPMIVLTSAAAITTHGVQRPLNEGAIMHSATFRASKLKSGALAVVFCLLPGSGVATVAAVLSANIGLGHMIVPAVIGSALIVTGLLSLYGVMIQLVRRGAIVTIDRQGILDIRNGLGLILWADIRSLKVMRRSFWSGSKRGIDYIGIYLRNPTPYLLRLPGWKRRLTAFGLRQGMPFAQISFLGLTPGVEEAVAYLRETSPLMLPGQL